MSIKTRRWLVRAILLLIVSPPICAWWLNTRWYANGPLADVTWTQGGGYGNVTCTVTDRAGNPIPNIAIRAYTSSGGTRGLTNEDGIAAWSPGEYDLLSLEVNNIIVMDRPGFLAPTLEHGLQIKIVLKHHPYPGKRLPNGD